jgi:polyphenol oxidase
MTNQGCSVTDPLPLWRSSLLDGFPHGFAGRRGGVSAGAFASLNTGHGSGEDAAIIAENRRRAANAVLPGAGLASVYQVHGRDCVTVREVVAFEERPHADAMVTDVPGLLLGILTADCVPVLFADRAAGVVGAAHAGWKGALAGVTDACVEAMVAAGADVSRIAAAVGPCIARASYEVDERLFRAFVEADAENERFFIDGRVAHWQFDLEAYVAARLAAAGVMRVELLGLDTYANESDFFSFRRATHRGEPGYGRQLSMIGVGA